MIGKTLLLAFLSLSPSLAQIPPPRRGGSVGHFRSTQAVDAPLPVVRITRKAARLSAGHTLRVPQQYSSIQSAIDAASDGDTVLVSRGTYFENIRYRGKAIVVGSLYLTDGDTAHIDDTIIDGSHSTDPDSGSVVYFIDGEDTTSVLCGLTIQGGTGTSWLYPFDRPHWSRLGGGVLCLSSGARIVRNCITRNRVIAQASGGGGLAVENLRPPVPSLILEGNRITDNISRGDSAEMWGYSGGADIRGVSARIVGNLFERDSAVGANVGAGGGISLQGVGSPALFPEALIQGNIFRSNTAMASRRGGVGGGVDIWAMGLTYVLDNLFEGNSATSVSGSAQGGGLCVEAEGATGFGRTIVANNRFVGNRLTSRNATGSNGAGIYVHFSTATITGNIFADNLSRAYAYADGGGMESYHSSVRIDGNMFVRNATGWPGTQSGAGGGLSIASGPPHGGEQVVVNNLFLENSAGYGGGGILAYEETSIAGGFVAIANNTVVGNRAGVMGGGILTGQGGQLLLNNIFWDDVIGSGFTAPNEITELSGAAIYHHNDIKGGWPGEGNIDVAPAFGDSTCRLSDTSACIGAGLDSVQIDSAGGWFHSPAFDFVGSPRPTPPGFPPDIGAVESPLAFGKDQPALVPKAATVNFRNVRPGTSDTLTVMILNRTTDARNISSLTFETDRYAIVPHPQLPIVVPGLQSVVIGVTFSPITPGEVVSDTLLVGTDDPVRPVFSVLLAGRGSAPVRCAEAGTLYGISSPTEGPVLYTLDRTTGRARFIGLLSPSPRSALCAFTLRCRDNTLYGAFTSPGGTDLYRFSSAFGDVEFAGTIPLENVTSMAAGKSDALYLATSQGKLYRGRIGLTDTLCIGYTGRPLRGLAFSPATSVLWGSLKDSLFTIDTLTGCATLLGVNGWGTENASIAFNCVGTLYELCRDWLVMIDKVTGWGREIGPTGVSGLIALAMRTDVVAGIEGVEGEQLSRWGLAQNYPNPFNPATTISYIVAGAPGPGSGTSHVHLVVYDLLGREVAVLVDERKAPGSYSVRFDAHGLASGMYLYRLQAGEFVQTRKLLVLR